MMQKHNVCSSIHLMKCFQRILNLCNVVKLMGRHKKGSSHSDLSTARLVGNRRNLPNYAPLIFCSEQNNSDWKCQSQVFHLQGYVSIQNHYITRASKKSSSPPKKIH